MVTLNKPSAGNTDWASDVNTNWTSIENELSGGAGAWKLIETITASSDATIDFTSNIDSTYKAYVVKLIGIVPATDNVALMMRISTDGGSTWESGGSDYRWVFNNTTEGFGPGRAADAADSEVDIVGSLGSAAAENLSGQVVINDPADTSLHKIIETRVNSENLHGETQVTIGTGQYQGGTTAIDGFRFFYSSGNVESGTFKLYGVS